MGTAFVFLIEALPKLSPTPVPCWAHQVHCDLCLLPQDHGPWQMIGSELETGWVISRLSAVLGDPHIYSGTHLPVADGLCPPIWGGVNALLSRVGQAASLSCPCMALSQFSWSLESVTAHISQRTSSVVKSEVPQAMAVTSTCTTG